MGTGTGAQMKKKDSFLYSFKQNKNRQTNKQKEFPFELLYLCYGTTVVYCQEFMGY